MRDLNTQETENDPLNCKSKNLIYLIERKKCGKQYSILGRPSAISTNALGSIHF